ncbi:hypothetical protein EPD60_02570 [Flaviaesturariibacter flavus]|uniref:Glycosyltransferase family 1 protein n=1 Tax=Flaviaesturariibacter flavus TaxID=2502780 RepID=A0A4V2NX02_9BACT|nr:hypothetical protein [Flaviaesturariibacter flavus]TCJ19322.1 hypothetical protein EPD60_02570 [Flaviaesturariibacter flavus]
MESLSRILFKVRRKLRKKWRDVTLFHSYLTRRSPGRSSTAAPAVWFDLTNNTYVRYLYILFKYFESAGYQVYVNGNLRFLLSLGDDYSRFIIEEEKVLFSAEPPAGAITFTDGRRRTPEQRQLSNDYFREEPGPGTYHIPIGMHPHMYKYGWWNAPVDDGNRQRSVFFAGNFDANDYKIFSATGRFTMMDRLAMAGAVAELPECRFPKSAGELESGRRHGTIDIVDKANFVVEQSELRPTIAQYAFFIACPGVFMPLSHNIYEAMSVGTIPILHEEYAQLFAPALVDGKNAVVFHNGNFTEKLREALAYPEEQAATMVGQVKAYYRKHLSPEAIVNELVNGRPRALYLNAEKTSIGLLVARARRVARAA